MDNTEINFPPTSLLGQFVREIKEDHVASKRLVEGLLGSALGEVQEIIAQNPGARRAHGEKLYHVKPPQGYTFVDSDTPRKLAELLARYVRNKKTIAWESFLHHTYNTEADMIAAVIVFYDTTTRI